jgi:hypothetical protein
VGINRVAPRGVCVTHMHAGMFLSFVYNLWATYVASTVFMYAAGSSMPYRVRRYLWEALASLYAVWRIGVIVSRHGWRATFDLSDVGTSARQHDIHAFVVYQAAWYVFATCIEVYNTLVEYAEHERTTSTDMLVHHIVTVSLFVVCELGRLEHVAFVVLALTTPSNPLLNVSKTLDYYKLPWKAHAFAAFGLVFIACRVVLFPVLVLRHTLTARHPSVWLVVSNVGLSFLYVMQLAWLRKIMFILSLTHKYSRGQTKRDTSPTVALTDGDD